MCYICASLLNQKYSIVVSVLVTNPPKPQNLRHCHNIPPLVLVVYCEEIAAAGRTIVYKLREEGIKATSHQFEEEECRRNITKWVDTKLREADFIVFLFDKHMDCEWKERKGSETSLIILHVEGLYKNDQDAAGHKCLALIKSEEDKKYVPTLMGSQRPFVWKDFGDVVNTNLIRAIHSVPQFDRPPVAENGQRETRETTC